MGDRPRLAVEPAEVDLMKPEDAAALLLQAPKTLANQRSRREGPPYVRLPNGVIRYSRKALLAYVEENTVAPARSA